MDRPLSILLADAFDSAAHDVFVAPQVHAACGDLAPTAWDNWVYWCRGFVAGLAGDNDSKPLLMRISTLLSNILAPPPLAKPPELKPHLIQKRFTAASPNSFCEGASHHE
ncbi:hypothetical protein YA0002_22460 [Pseudomonas cichorii]|uniref:hypothetical protein n=1 Tax=Pseudomonas cichorii TaxID=36746 RepID=UPI0018E5E14F|nr:hypothetical protein [Pseudomonas cichorii]MBI6855529.1 hypothetical protein [Pseudomonas cichorii]